MNRTAGTKGHWVAAFLGVLSVCLASLEAGPFINLDFELAETNNVIRVEPKSYVSGQGSVQDLLPGWNLAFGTNFSRLMGLNAMAMDLGSDSLVSREALADPQFQAVFPFGFQGEYAFAVNADYAPIFLSQTGEVPADSRLLRIEGAGYFSTRTEVRLNGVFVMGGATFTNLTGDIFAFAGQTAELEIKMFLGPESPDLGHSVGLDTITFAPPPSLSVSRSGSQLLLHWPTSLSGFVVQGTGALASAASWQTLTNRVDVTGDQYSVKVDPDGSARYYHLKFVPTTPGG